jgi:hypothetical protein
VRRPARLVGVRRVAILSVAVAGLGLFGTGVRGLAQVDGELASATKRPAAEELRHEIEARSDCPWEDGRQARPL